MNKVNNIDKIIHEKNITFQVKIIKKLQSH